MGRYKLVIDPKNDKFIRKQDPQTQARIYKAVKNLGANPRPPGVRKMVDYPGWRIRVGGTRILYTINDREKVVRIYKLAPRGEAY